MSPFPQHAAKMSRFWGRCLALQIVEALVFTRLLANPSSGCCVRMSNTCTKCSRVVHTSLFIGMSFRSNSTPQTPFPTQASHRISFILKSHSLTSPLSNPAATHRSSALCALPNATDQQSRGVSPCTGSNAATGTSFCRWSQTRMHPSRLPVTISGALFAAAIVS